MSPLPCWASLTRQQIAEKTRALIEDVVADARRRGTPVLGVSAVLSQDPHAMPAESKRSPAPQCHAASGPLREAFRIAYRTFVDAFRAAANALRSNPKDREVPFPPGSFPCGARYVMPEEDFVPPWSFRVPDLWSTEFAVAT
jgi:hypothetical protein